MKITKADEGVLVIAFAEKLQETRITDYRYAPVGRGWEENVYSTLDEKFVKTLKSHIDGSLEAFFQERVFFRFYGRGNKVPAKGEEEAPLTTYQGFEEPLKVAQDFVRFLKSLPLQYTVVAPCNNRLNDHLNEWNAEFTISDQLSIVKGAEILDEIVLDPINSDYCNYLTRWARYSDSIISLDSDKYYFRFRQSGYVCQRAEPRIVADFGDAIKAFYGSAVASDVFYPISSSFDGVNPAIIIAKKDGDGWVLASAAAAEEDLKKCMNLSLVKSARDNIESGKRISETFSLSCEMFRSEDRQRLSTSAIWLLRAYLSDRDMDQILFAAIAVEVLLGDREASDRIGLTKLMANRCAYTLGSSVADRQAIADSFTRWYKLRSEIVHSGRMRVSDEERKTMRDGIRLASRLLQHEIKMARKP